jgi:hypothetical protein
MRARAWRRAGVRRGELSRVLVLPVAQPQVRKKLFGPGERLGLGLPPHKRRQGHVLQGGEILKEIVKLEHEADEGSPVLA